MKDEKFWENTSWWYYSVAIAAINVHNNTTTLTVGTARIIKIDNESNNAKYNRAYNASIILAGRAFPTDHFYAHRISISLINELEFKRL